uniref:Uncharacterized protein n=1 Tax=Arion vulgaris TaxID=1028688 RepID=A0A0B6XZN4_9EUPU
MWPDETAVHKEHALSFWDTYSLHRPKKLSVFILYYFSSSGMETVHTGQKSLHLQYDRTDSRLLVTYLNSRPMAILFIPPQEIIRLTEFADIRHSDWTTKLGCQHNMNFIMNDVFGGPLIEINAMDTTVYQLLISVSRPGKSCWI